MDETKQAIAILEEAGYSLMGSGWCKDKTRVMIAESNSRSGSKVLIVTIFANVTIKSILNFCNTDSTYKPVSQLKTYL